MKRLPFALVVALVTGLPPIASIPQNRPLEGLLGYRVGEERRYALGPAEDLYEGESASWKIRLDRIVEAEDGRRGVFVIHHQRTPPDAFAAYVHQRGSSLRSTITGEVIVNAHGFPLEVNFRTERRRGSAGDEVYTVQYVWEDDGFTKRAWRHREGWEFRIGSPSHEHLDRDVPIGAWAFRPGPLYCRDPWWSFSLGPSQGVGSAPRSETTCPYEEAAFLHPGLLELAMPTLREDGDGERALLFFKPAGPILDPGMTVGIPFVVPPQVLPPSIPGQPPGPSPHPAGLPPRAPSGIALGPAPNAALGVSRDPRLYFETIRSSVIGKETIEVAGRRLTTTLVRFDEPLGDAWLDGDGSIVRLVIPPAEPPGPPQGGPRISPLASGSPLRFIRRLFPSEY